MKILKTLLFSTLFFFLIGTAYTHAATGDLAGNASSVSIGNLNLTGVNFLTTGAGTGSGFATSSLGQISFDYTTISAGVCPQGGNNCGPKIAWAGNGTGTMSGFARACSVFETGCSGTLKSDLQRGGWDGFINLNGVSVSATGFLSGYGWGDWVVGWVNFAGVSIALTAITPSSMTVVIDANPASMSLANYSGSTGYTGLYSSVSGLPNGAYVTDYKWELVSKAPTTASAPVFDSGYSSPYSYAYASSTFVSGLSVGKYKFKLTILDNASPTKNQAISNTVEVNICPFGSEWTGTRCNPLPIVTVNPPTATLYIKAGSATPIPTSVTISGTTATDDDASAPTLSWAGNAQNPSVATFSNATVLNPTISGLNKHGDPGDGIYGFVLTATDSEGGKGYGYFTVYTQCEAGSTWDTNNKLCVVNKPPTISFDYSPLVAPVNSFDFGFLITVTWPDDVPLKGSATDQDSDGWITSGQWAKSSGNLVTTSTGLNKTGSIPNKASFGAVVKGLPVSNNNAFGLTATDNKGGSVLKYLYVNVVCPVGQFWIAANSVCSSPPVVNAGLDQSITTNSTTVTGTATDSDGIKNSTWMFVKYYWDSADYNSSNFINPPAVSPDPSPSNPSALSTTISGMIKSGVYTFKLAAADNNDLVSSNEMIITVDLPKSGTLNATNCFIQSQASTCNSDVTGSVSELTSDAEITKDNPNSVVQHIYPWQWSPGFFSFGTTEQVDFGDTNFYLKTDSDTKTLAQTKITTTCITGASWSVSGGKCNFPPVADPNTNSTDSTYPNLMWPASKFILNGGGTDPDGNGTIIDHEWSVVSAPAGASPVFDNKFFYSPRVSGMTETGTYVFGLTVTDNLGSIGYAEAQIKIPAVVILTANPKTVKKGDPSTLTWATIQGSILDTCSIPNPDPMKPNLMTNDTPVGGVISGSVGTGPIVQKTTFTVICKDNASGKTASASAIVNIKPEIKEF